MNQILMDAKQMKEHGFITREAVDMECAKDDRIILPFLPVFILIALFCIACVAVGVTIDKIAGGSALDELGKLFGYDEGYTY